MRPWFLLGVAILCWSIELAAQPLGRTEAFGRISPDKSIYALVSTEGLSVKTIKYQVSFKYQLFKVERWDNALAKNLNRLYLAYSLKAFWSVGEASAPFEEIDHSPEVFWERWYAPDRQVQLLRLGLWEHESDGEQGGDSASWDRQYVQVRFFRMDADYNWNLEFKLWRLVDHQRPWQVLLPWNYLFPWRADLLTGGVQGEILKRFGHWEFTPIFTYRGHTPRDVEYRFQASATVRKWPWPDRNGRRTGALQGDLRWIVPGGVGDPILYCQLWRGYGERLRGYREFRPLSPFPFKVKAGVQLKP